MEVGAVAGQTGLDPHNYHWLSASIDGVADAIDKSALDADAVVVVIHIEVLLADEALSLLPALETVAEVVLCQTIQPVAVTELLQETHQLATVTKYPIDRHIDYLGDGVGSEIQRKPCFPTTMVSEEKQSDKAVTIP